jgi:hypothetical protein
MGTPSTEGVSSIGHWTDDSLSRVALQLAIVMDRRPNGLPITRAAPIDRESNRAESNFQNADDLGAAQRRYNESVAASIHSLAREAKYG